MPPHLNILYRLQCVGDQNGFLQNPFVALIRLGLWVHYRMGRLGQSIIQHHWFGSAFQTWQWLQVFVIQRLIVEQVAYIQVYLEETSQVAVGWVFNSSRCPILADSLQHSNQVWKVKFVPLQFLDFNIHFIENFHVS